VYVYSNSLNVSSTHVLIVRGINCISTTSGVCHSMLVTVWYAGLDGTPSKSAFHMVTYIEWHIPDVVLIKLTLLTMSTWVLETC